MNRARFSRLIRPAVIIALVLAAAMAFYNVFLDPEPTEFWGPSAWRFIHSMATCYTPDQKEAFKKFMGTLPQLLPCERCRRNLKKNLVEHPLNEASLADNDSLFLWTYKLHDMVNRELGKSSPSYESVRAKYWKELRVANQCE
jgi:hypothetical protein